MRVYIFLSIAFAIFEHGVDAQCFSDRMATYPKVTDIAIYERFVSAPEKTDILKIRTSGDISEYYSYSRLYRNAKGWFFETDSLTSPITTDFDLVGDNSGATRTSHYVFRCAGTTPRQTYYYFLRIDGVIVKSLVSNIEIQNPKTNSNEIGGTETLLFFKAFDDQISKLKGRASKK